MIESGQDLFLPKTVALELAWVLVVAFPSASGTTSLVRRTDPLIGVAGEPMALMALVEIQSPRARKAIGRQSPLNIQKATRPTPRGPHRFINH